MAQNINTEEAGTLSQSNAQLEGAEAIKELVRSKYTEIADQDVATNRSSCCGAGGCSSEVYSIMSEDYTKVPGYQDIADLGLGCGVPTEFARIHEGDVVVDLGSGAGNDCFVARALCGERGKVIGIDFTPAMISKARDNADKLGFHNVEFRQGDIDDIPMAANRADVVISNCVLNLVPDKQKVIQEIYRILKPGGHFSISDVVLVGELPEELRNEAEMYAGCVAGAIQRDEYLGFIREAGFSDILIQKEKEIVIPDDILSRYVDAERLEQIRKGESGIFSLSVYACKPLADKDCCGPDCCCS